MKKVFENSELAHVWANQLQDEGRNSGGTFYFRNETIYSYGSHFPIASIFNEDTVLMTSRSYSMTTNQHQRKVYSAVSNKKRISCYDPYDAIKGNHSENLSHWFKSIDTVQKLLINARKPEKYIAQIDYITNAITKYTNLFSIELTEDQKVLIDIKDKDKYIAVIKEKAAKDAKKVKESIERGKPLFEAYLIAYHNFNEKEYGETINRTQKADAEAYHGTLNQNTLLRTDGIQVFTSKGLKMPVNVAKRYFNFYNRVVDAGGCKGNCNYKMLEYEVTKADKDGLTVGCHNIPVSEINNLAIQLNW